jgi:hypothetical protein
MEKMVSSLKLTLSNSNMLGAKGEVGYQPSMLPDRRYLCLVLSSLKVLQPERALILINAFTKLPTPALGALANLSHSDCNIRFYSESGHRIGARL